MLGDITVADEIYIVTSYTDMRKSIDGLCAIIKDQLKMDPRRSALYLFCGKRCDRIKALLWEPDGHVLVPLLFRVNVVMIHHYVLPHNHL
uniref:IS66 family insertion sequence element accessory protein TnpB n=1 Tax=Roseburia hominis TaxID=301301 RepID=UPI004037A980